MFFDVSTPWRRQRFGGVADGTVGVNELRSWIILMGSSKKNPAKNLSEEAYIISQKIISDFSDDFSFRLKVQLGAFIFGTAHTK